MMPGKNIKRPIGQILLDGGFLSHPDLRLALEEQKKTNELLGQTLVRMHVLDPTDVNAVLSVQERLGRAEDAAKTAAGVRRMLGALLVQAGHITNRQLARAVAEQKQTGEKIGEVFVRLGLLTEQQLGGVLDFQRNQGAAIPSPGPLRLGELLITTGCITRRQLEDAVAKQALSGKKLGEVLIEEGHVQPRHIKRGLRLQQMLITAALVALLTACGTGGAAGNGETVSTATGTSATGAVSNADQQHASANYLTVTQDEYGLIKPTFYYSSDTNAFWSIQSDVADNVWDPNFKTIIRIDIPKSENGAMPSIGGKTYSIEDTPLYEKFPGSFFVFNGERSVRKKVERGTISFSPDSTESEATGNFDVVMTDYDSATVPPPQYRLKGVFGFTVGTYGPADPLPATTTSLR